MYESTALPTSCMNKVLNRAALTFRGLYDVCAMKKETVEKKLQLSQSPATIESSHGRGEQQTFLSY